MRSMNGLGWIAFAAAGLLAASRIHIPPPASAAETRPNVLVIMTDDQRADDMRVLPKTQALLAHTGTTFTNSIVSCALCCPSRATFLTGQYPHNHGVHANSGAHGGYRHLDSSNTLAVWLQKAGYYTAHVGKYLNGYGTDSPKPPAGWTRWFGLIDPTTYNLHKYQVSDNGVPVTYGDRATDYQTDVLAVEAERILRSRAGTGQPFLLSVAPLAPHQEIIDGRQVPPRPAPRHKGRFANEPLPASPSINELETGDKPAHIRRLPLLNTIKLTAAIANHRARLTALQAVDDLVERLVDALADTGQLENTVIIFTSDNGFFLGEHRIPNGKYLPYEESIRVPLIVRGGGFPPGATASQPVSNIDLAPTIVALTGIVPGRVMDGLPLLPLALDPLLARERTLLVEGLRTGGSEPRFAGVRDPSRLYVEYANGDRELYDLRTDPFELRSRHGAPALAAARADLALRLARLRACSGPSCR